MTAFRPISAATAALFGATPLDESALQQKVRSVLTPLQRPEQLKFALSVAAVIDAPDPVPGQGGRIVAVQADTGVGKTRGYLVPAALSAALGGGKTVIATHSLALMKQLLEHEVPIAQKLLAAMGLGFSVGLRLGRRNFIDPQRVAALAESVPAMRLWLGIEGLFAEAFEERGLELPPSVSIDDVCLTPASSKKAQTEFRRHCEHSAQVDVLITTHAMLLADARRWGRIVIKDQRSIAIIDEADQLAQAAESDAVVRTGLSRLIAIADAVGGVVKMKADVRALITPSLRVVRENDPAIGVVAGMIERLKQVQAEGDIADDIDATVLDLEDWIAAVESRHDSAILEPGALVTVTPDAGRVASRLWSSIKGDAPMLRSVALVSATLGGDDKGKFTELLGRLGVWAHRANYDATASGVIAIKDYGRMDMVLADRNIPHPFTAVAGGATRNPQWLEYAVAGIEAARAEGGRVLVLVPSYDEASLFGLLVSGSIAHRRGEKLSELVERFVADPVGVLVTPAAWAGLDLPGLIRHIVIPRVPYRPPDMAVDAAYVAGAQARGFSEDAIRGVLMQRRLADARRKLRQGLGRGIRQSTDQVKAWILDGRFPLPVNQLADLRSRLDNGAAVGHEHLRESIPLRFKLHPRTSVYATARIFSGHECAK